MKKYTKDGLRVLALAYKEVNNLDSNNIKTLKREEIETDLIFIGFLIMENTIKPETNAWIASLKEAEILTIMATGDNGLTAISVGRNCGIIDSEKTVFLAELVKNKQHSQVVKWLKVDVSKPVDIQLDSPTRRLSLTKNLSMERRDTLSRINHVAGFDEYRACK